MAPRSSKQVNSVTLDRAIPLGEDTAWILVAGSPSKRVKRMMKEAIETGYMDWFIVQIPSAVLVDR